MGIFDAVKGMAEEFSSGGNHAAVAGGLMQELGGAGGVAGLVQTLQQNGAGGLVQQWASGQTQPADASSIEQGIGGNVVNGIAQRTGLSPDNVRMGLAVLVPLIVHHMVSNGHVTAAGEATGNPAPATGNLIQSVLAKLV